MLTISPIIFPATTDEAAVYKFPSQSRLFDHLRTCFKGISLSQQRFNTSLLLGPMAVGQSLIILTILIKTPVALILSIS